MNKDDVKEEDVKNNDGMDCVTAYQAELKELMSTTAKKESSENIRNRTLVF